jgi:hypothetical protein
MERTELIEKMKKVSTGLCRLGQIAEQNTINEAIALLEKPRVSAEEYKTQVIVPIQIKHKNYCDLNGKIISTEFILDKAHFFYGDYGYVVLHDYAGQSDAVEFMQWTDLKGYNYKYGSLYSRYDNNNSGLTTKELYQAFLNREEKQK